MKFREGAIWRDLIIAASGALIAVVATMVFDLRVHIGLETVIGPTRYLVAAVGGAVAAYALNWGVREYWGI